MASYYVRKPGRLYERMEDTWCPEYEASDTKNQEYVHIEEFISLQKENERLKEILQISDHFKFITGVEFSKFNQGYECAREDIKEIEQRVWQEAVAYLKSQYDQGFHGL